MHLTQAHDPQYRRHGALAGSQDHSHDQDLNAGLNTFGKERCKNRKYAKIVSRQGRHRCNGSYRVTPVKTGVQCSPSGFPPARE